jgi:hypothetical protein
MPDADENHFRRREIELLNAARDWGLGYGVGGWASDLQLLADLQHYGTATRLIDVSSNPMTALWFACQEMSEPGDLSRDGLLIAVNTHKWLRFGRSIPKPTYTAHDNPQGWELEDALSSERPFVVESLLPNERLRAQEGFFIAGAIPTEDTAGSPFASITVPYDDMSPDRLHGLLTRPATERSSEHGRLPFVAVLIPAELKSRVLMRLQNSYNRRPRVLFPDYSGFLQYSRVAHLRKEPSGSSNDLHFSGYPRDY